MALFRRVILRVLRKFLRVVLRIRQKITFPRFFRAHQWYPRLNPFHLILPIWVAGNACVAPFCSNLFDQITFAYPSARCLSRSCQNL